MLKLLVGLVYQKPQLNFFRKGEEPNATFFSLYLPDFQIRSINFLINLQSQSRYENSSHQTRRATRISLKCVNIKKVSNPEIAQG